MTSYPEPTAAERRAWFYKKQHDRRRAIFRNEVGKISSFVRLREMLESAEHPWQAEIIRARLEQQLAHRATRRLKRRAREAAARAEAEADQERRVSDA